MFATFFSFMISNEPNHPHQQQLTLSQCSDVPRRPLTITGMCKEFIPEHESYPVVALNSGPVDLNLTLSPSP